MYIHNYYAHGSHHQHHDDEDEESTQGSLAQQLTYSLSFYACLYNYTGVYADNDYIFISNY